MRSRPRWAFVHPFQLRVRRGIETYLWDIACSLIEAGVDVDILTWRGGLDVPSYARTPSIRVRAMPATRYYEWAAAVPYFAAWLAWEGYSHVITHFASHGEGAALRILGLLRATPFSIVFHFPESASPFQYEQIARWGLDRRARHLIAVSEPVADEVSAWCGRPCSVIGHGVDCDRFRPDEETRRSVRDSLGISQSAPILITAAALEERKGIDWVIRALPRIAAHLPETRYLIVGEGPHRRELERAVEALHLQRHVHLCGVVSEVERYLAASDVGLLLSRKEALGLSVLEYAASALPVVTSDRPPFDKLVGPAWGIRVKEDDVDSVAENILGLLVDSSTRHRMGTAGRAHVQECYSWTTAAQRYRALIG